MGYGTTTLREEVDDRDMFTFNADMISSYELGSDEPSDLVNTTNLFTASADQILNQMGKVSVLIPLYG
jgi:hypothetical protein